MEKKINENTVIAYVKSSPIVDEGTKEKCKLSSNLTCPKVKNLDTFTFFTLHPFLFHRHSIVRNCLKISKESKNEEFFN